MSKIKSIIAAFAVMLPFLFTSCDKDVKVSGVQITPEEVTLGVGETQKLTVTVEPSDATDPAYSGVQVPLHRSCDPQGCQGCRRSAGTGLPEVDLGNELTQGYFEFDGDIYKTGGVSNNWLICLADSRVDFTKQNLVGPGKILMLELNTAHSDGKVLPAGTFNVLNPMEITAAAYLTPFTVVPGLAAEDGSIYGTWYLATDTQGGDFQPLCAAQKRTVSVKKTGDTYTIDFDITDDDFKISVKGSYTGKPYIYDHTANTTSVSTRAAAASGKALNIHKSARRQAFRK